MYTKSLFYSYYLVSCVESDPSCMNKCQPHGFFLLHSFSDLQKSVCFLQFPRVMVRLFFFFFILVAWNHHIMLHVCWRGLYLSLCTWTLYLSFLFLCHPIRVGDWSCKTLVINRDFWYAHPPKDDPNGKNGIFLVVKNSLLCLLFDVCFDNKSVFLSSTHFLNLDICCLLCFPYIGLFLLTIPMLCLMVFPVIHMKWCTRHSAQTFTWICGIA